MIGAGGRTRLGLLALFLCATGLPVRAGVSERSVLVVDDDGGPLVDHTTIQAAIDAASPGDLVLVRPGAYDAFVSTKGLTLVGDDGALVRAGTTILSLPAGEPVALSKLELAGLDVLACAASVVLDDVRLTAAFDPLPSEVLLRRQLGPAASSRTIRPSPGRVEASRSSGSVRAVSSNRRSSGAIVRRRTEGASSCRSPRAMPRSTIALG